MLLKCLGKAAHELCRGKARKNSPNSHSLVCASTLRASPSVMSSTPRRDPRGCMNRDGGWHSALLEVTPSPAKHLPPADRRTWTGFKNSSVRAVPSQTSDWGWGWHSRSFWWICPPFIIFFPFIFISWRLITLQYCVVFAIHWHESAMDLHVFPIPIPDPIPSHPIPLGCPSARSTCRRIAPLKRLSFISGAHSIILTEQHFTTTPGGRLSFWALRWLWEEPLNFRALSVTVSVFPGMAHCAWGSSADVHSVAHVTCS